LSEERLQQIVERPEEVGECDPFVHGEAFDLMKGRRVCRVRRIPPVDAPK